MNFIDKLRIKRNPNIIDTFSSDKIKNDMIMYALNCGYKFNPETMKNLISYQTYREAFKDEREVFDYLKEAAITNSNENSKRTFYSIYANLDRELEKYVTIMKEDSELSENFAKELEAWLNVSTRLKMESILEIVDGKDELLDELLQNHFDTLENNVEFNDFSSYIVLKKTPQELYNQNIRNSEINKAFIQAANPQNYLELFEYAFDDLSVMEGIEYQNLLLANIENNIEQFIPYLEKLDEVYNSKTQGRILTDNIKSGAINYLKENNVLYNESVPKFALSDNEYVLQCIKQSPDIIQSLGRLDNFNLDDYEEDIEYISRKISDEQIKFEGIIPNQYLANKSIFESIVGVNPELLQKPENNMYLTIITEGMTEEETLDYYKRLGVPFNRNTIYSDENISILLECLKNDHGTIPFSSKQYTKEEYQKIYEIMKDEIEPEEILTNGFLTRNPYFAKELLESGIDLSNVNFQETMYYDEFYLDLKATALKNGIDIPEPKNYNDIIKSNEDKQIYIELDTIENIKKGLDYLKEKEINQDLLIVLEQEKFDEFIISDNIEFFENLAENNINVNFKYDTGENVFSLKNVLDKEHFMQHAADDIKSKKFSPLEQLIAIYDITKVFKPYEDTSSRNSSESRSLYEYLENDYMVCAGYSDLVSNLSHRLNLNVTKARLDISKSNGELEGHVRNYVNLVDPKYGIDGFYAMEPTWEQDGKMRRTKYEQFKSSYKDFLLTTDEGRKNYIGGKIEVGSYDSAFTSTTKDGLNAGMAQMGKRFYDMMKDLDPKFSSTLDELNTQNDKDAEVVLDYLKRKVNNPVPKEALLDAIINVKKTIYLNLSEQDFEDMRMGYSMTDPFAENVYDSNGLWVGFKSLYGDEKYNEYMERRYNDIKSEPTENAMKKNPCLNVNQVIKYKKDKEAKNSSIEKTQTQKLGEETLEEQNDTKGKIDVKSDMDRQLTEINRTQEDLIQ